MNLLTRRGFTLIELLIVVAIIAILAAIAVPNFIEAQTRAKVSRVRTDLRTVATGLESYAVDNNKYPPEMRSFVGGTVPPRWGFPASTGYHQTGHSPARLRDNGPMEAISARLTTPVAYLSSVMGDPFRANRTVQLGEGVPASWAGAVLGLSYQTGNPFDSTYTYHNVAMRSAIPGQTSYVWADLQDYGSWRIYSIGPMGLVWAIGTGDSSMGWKYDPTNGTMSTGYVIRTQKDATGENFSRN